MAWPDDPIASPDWTAGGVTPGILWSKISARFNALRQRMADNDKTTGTTDASGYATVTHNLNYTPSNVFVFSHGITNLAGAAQIAVGADTYTSTTFRVRFINLTAAGPAGEFHVQPAASLPFNIGWVAYR